LAATWTTRSTVTNGQSVKYTVIDRSPSRSSSMASSGGPHSGCPGTVLGSLLPGSTPTKTPSPPFVSQSADEPTDRAG